jgi:hypothetical protein
VLASLAARFARRSLRSPLASLAARFARRYLSTPGQEHYGYLMLAMLGSKVLLLTMTSFVNGMKKGRLSTKMVVDVLFSLTGLKVALDSYRVCAGKQYADVILGPFQELMCSKIYHVFCCSIPGCMLQVYVMLRSLESGLSIPPEAFLSVLVSASATGVMSATISWDYDVDPQKRSEAPSHYGFIPMASMWRNVVYCCMVAMSVLLLLLRCCGAAMLMVVAKR